MRHPIKLYPQSITDTERTPVQIEEQGILDQEQMKEAEEKELLGIVAYMHVHRISWL